MPQCRWKQPELSVGSPCASLDLLGRYKCWLVKDKSPAHAVWKAVSKPIISLLDDQFEHLDAGDSDLIFEMFMIGRKPTSTVPTILFSCESKTCRQKAMALVQKKSILAAHPGVHMAECSRLPKLLAQEEDSELLFLPAGIYLDGPLRTCGTSVLISFGPKKLPRKATIGGIVCIDETLYGVTAGHAFTQPKGNNTSDKDDIEFSFFGGDDPFDSSEDEDDENELVEMTSQASMSSGSSRSPGSNDFEFGGRRRESLTSSLSSGSIEKSTNRTHSSKQKGLITESTPERYGTLFTSSDPDESFDWALVRIEHPTLLAFPRTDEYMANNVKLGKKIIYPSSIASGSLDADVVVCTGTGGVVQGRLSGVAAYKRAAGQTEFQQLSTISLSMETFNEGDCGSWVCDLRTGAVYGHIVSGYPGTGSAYLVPSDQIFEDMQRTLEKSVQLLTRSLAARNTALAIWGHIDTDSPPSAESEAQNVTSTLMTVPKDLISGLTSVELLEFVKKITPELVKVTKARPAFVEDVDEEGEVVPDTRIIASLDETSRPTRLSRKTRSKSHGFRSDSEHLSEETTASYTAPSGGKGRDTLRDSNHPMLKSQLAAAARKIAIEKIEKGEAEKDVKTERRKAAQSVTTKAQRPSSARPHDITRKPSGPSGRVVPGTFGFLAQDEANNAPPRTRRPIPLRPRDTTPTTPQSIPLRPRARSSVGSRPLSFYGTRDNGYLSGLPPAISPAYNQPENIASQPSYDSYGPPGSSQYRPPSIYQYPSSPQHPQWPPAQPSYLPPSSNQFRPPSIYQYQSPPQNSIVSPGPAAGPQVYDYSPPQPRSLSGRFAPPEPVSRENRPLDNDSDDEYISATELGIGGRNTPGPARPKSAIGTKDYGKPAPQLRTASRVDMGDRRVMAAPPPPIGGKGWEEHEISHLQRPEVNRRFVSYDIDERTGVRIESAMSSSASQRRQSHYGEGNPTDSKTYDEKIRQAVSYQNDMGAPILPLTAETLRKAHRIRAPSSRDTRSTISSRRTRSRSRSRSLSSASSATSRDDSSFKPSANTYSGRTRSGDDNDKDVTIKISRGARVTVGGTRFDCNDGGEIVINRLRSVLDEDRTEDRMNYDFPKTENLRRRFDRPASTLEDEKSSLSMRSSASDDTVKGKGREKPDSSSGLAISSIWTPNDQATKSNESAKDDGEIKRPLELAARELDKAIKNRPKVAARRCGTCLSGGRGVWVIPGKVCPICGTPC